MTNKTIHFAHANGFPAASYKKFLNHLPSGYTVIAKDKYAHDPQFPLNDNWENQIDEMITYIEQNKKTDKVIAIGHSFGAVLSYMAVCRRSDLFSGLIMFDPPLITGLSRYLFRFAKTNRLIDKLTPAGITRLRNQKWASHHNLFEYFSGKALFKDFDPDCIHDYINAVIDESNGFKILNFNVEIEANIFRTIPHNLPSYKGKLKVPSTLFTGKHTNVCVPVLRNPFLKNNSVIEHKELDFGGHMFPLEKPIELAKQVNKILENL